MHKCFKPNLTDSLNLYKPVALYQKDILQHDHKKRNSACVSEYWFWLIRSPQRAPAITQTHSQFSLLRRNWFCQKILILQVLFQSFLLKFPEDCIPTLQKHSQPGKIQELKVLSSFKHSRLKITCRFLIFRGIEMWILAGGGMWMRENAMQKTWWPERSPVDTKADRHVKDVSCVAILCSDRH